MHITDESIFEAPPQDPVPVLRSWLNHAIENNASEPGAMAFATAGTSGRPSNRIIQILEIRPEGLVFATHAQSPKGKDIAETGWASGVFYWRETKRQAIVSGIVAPLPDRDSDILWSSRPVESHAMSTVSTQSATLEDEEALRAHALEARKAGALPRPKGWLGYILRPSAVEFWQFAPDRLYKRLRYEGTESAWASRRLQP
ncbi:pyridoxal 5'-phosphate synthase [Paraburkholderia phenazinium]|jgi:pyridoxamine-phosphate oxidase|uniref:Pyridoxamine 5'-phosphate oxidase n=1 Tax=Paraburkholderia phenazinium TaxID=60549 RepID=A0A1G8JFR9_9BURK|nr:pyridoxal 5'-phosphate synthase [Paraburkholderia phenazinium]SDI30045.1 Pyridoxamine 5'-phosphate oxidase [Paraburkholderia phenazinium]